MLLFTPPPPRSVNAVFLIKTRLSPLAAQKPNCLGEPNCSLPRAGERPPASRRQNLYQPTRDRNRNPHGAFFWRPFSATPFWGALKKDTPKSVPSKQLSRPPRVQEVQGALRACPRPSQVAPIIQRLPKAFCLYSHVEENPCF